MKIYFCGSIRGGRQDAVLYAQIIEKLKNYGSVLTEHIGDDAMIGREKDDAWIWDRDCAWLRESDIVVAECTQVSLGVGYELAYARALGKPAHVLYRGTPGTLSAMIAGDPYFRVHDYSGIEDLAGVLERIFVSPVPCTEERLLDMARNAMKASYSPYSQHAVGAALLCEDGRIFTGCNVENASFGLTVCAERSAVFSAVSARCRRFSAIAIAAEKTAPWPCGACRQVLNEFAQDLQVLVTWGEGWTARAKLGELLPYGFGPDELNADHTGSERG